MNAGADASATAPVDLEKVAAEVLADYKLWRTYRTPHEGDWYVNAAMLRNNQHVVYDNTSAQLVRPAVPSYAVQLDTNKILPKHRARMARFFKNRPRPVVIPASTEYRDLMDARASERALDYQWRRLRLETAYRDARQWASVASKSYWWIGYDENVTGQVQLTDEVTGEKRHENALLGDVFVEVGNAFEVFVPDPTKARISQQPKILRAQSITKDEAARRFPQLAAHYERESRSADVLTLKATEDSIASFTSGGSVAASATTTKRNDQEMLFQHFTAPCGKYPKGRKVVQCGSVVVDYAEELPFEFWDSPTNPYPCVEFSDSGLVGQFWQATWISQLIPLQRALNRVLELILENLEAVGRPKIVVYKQHQLPEGAWTSSAGEIVTLNWLPGLPEPRVVQATSVVGDAWNLLNFLLRQFDDMSQIQTAAEGGSGGAESGYQTNLLQEASDAVHQPDIRGDELTIEDAAWKIRRIMKLTWDVPRLIAVGGDGSLAEMMEFSQRQINDAAEVRIQAGSMMPDLKAAKAETALRYYKEGLFGDPADPMVKRRALQSVDMDGTLVISEEDRLDEFEAQRENQALFDGDDVAPAAFSNQHLIHIQKHEAKMKTPEWAMLPNEQKLIGIAHTITHYDWVNLPLAMGLRQQYGLMDLPIASPPPPEPSGAAPAAPAPSGPTATA